MAKHKGDSSTNIFTPQGRKNFDQIKKACGCQFGEKCRCLTEQNFVDCLREMAGKPISIPANDLVFYVDKDRVAELKRAVGK